MVDDFVTNCKSGKDAELAFFGLEHFDVALDHAALAKDQRGKRFSHQRRLTRASLAEARSKLFDRASMICEATSFAEVLNIVRSITAEVSGLRRRPLEPVSPHPCVGVIEIDDAALVEFAEELVA